MVFADPMPDQTALDNFNSAYFLNAHGVTKRDLVTETYFSAVASSRVRYLEENIMLSNVDRILEVGPGPGYLAAKLLDRYPGLDYQAIESDTSSHSKLQALGVNVVQEPSQDIDIVIMSHVLEHVTSPANFVNYYANFLSNDGCLFIEVPCEDYLYKDKDEPHLLFFSLQALKVFLEKLGFQIEKLSFHGKTHKSLTKENKLRRFLERIKLKLLRCKYTLPYFDTMDLESHLAKMYDLDNSPNEPTWWLRVIAKRISNHGSVRK